MSRINYLLVLFCYAIPVSCNNKLDFDGSGYFESDEVIVSAQQNGALLSFNLQEGDVLKANDTVGHIDVIISELQKQQMQASISALAQKTSSPQEQTDYVRKQLAVLHANLDYQLKEKARTENLVKADAATQKQLDYINNQVEQLQKQINATEQQISLNTFNINTANRSILSETKPLEISAKVLQQQIDKGQIVNPITGTVLSKYMFEGELAINGKPLYKIASLDTLNLKAYITGDKLTQVKIGQAVTVRVDQGNKNYKSYPATITWISNTSEFTPKTIQTRDERANLVYAVKARVKNDGYLRIGMYGEVILLNSK